MITPVRNWLKSNIKVKLVGKGVAYKSRGPRFESTTQRRKHKKARNGQLKRIGIGFTLVEASVTRLFGKIQTSQKGGKPYSDTSPYGECSLCLYPSCLWRFFMLSMLLPYLKERRIDGNKI